MKETSQFMQPPLLKNKKEKAAEENLIIDLCFSETALRSRYVSDWEKQNTIFPICFYPELVSFLLFFPCQ